MCKHITMKYVFFAFHFLRRNSNFERIQLDSDVYAKHLKIECYYIC